MDDDKINESFKTKNNYEKDSTYNNINNNSEFVNRDIVNDKTQLKDEPIVFQQIIDDDVKFNRISNLKDNELPIEDKIQIQNHIYNDYNDNENEQIEIFSNILNNFGKEKHKNRYICYKNKNKYKSKSVTNQKNYLLNKIKNDIAKINFENEMNKIYKNYNNNLYGIKLEKLNLNLQNNIKVKKINNILRIEEIKKKFFLLQNKKNMNDDENNITQKKNHINKTMNNNNNDKDKEGRYNNSYKKNIDRDKIYSKLFQKNNKVVNEIKINNFNFNKIYNITTFRGKKRYEDNNDDLIFPVNAKKEININIRSKEIGNLNHSNQFFYNVFNNSMKKYPYLHLLKGKINKMKYSNLSQPKIITKNDNRSEIPLLEKILNQKDILLKEIDKFKKNE